MGSVGGMGGGGGLSGSGRGFCFRCRLFGQCFGEASVGQHLFGQNASLCKTLHHHDLTSQHVVLFPVISTILFSMGMRLPPSNMGSRNEPRALSPCLPVTAPQTSERCLVGVAWGGVSV